MVIWKGLGFLVGIISFAIMIATEYFTEQHFNDETYYQTHAWPIILAFTVSGLIAFPIGKFLNKTKNNHSLFFIPIQHLIIVFPIVGLIFGLSI